MREFLADFLLEPLKITGRKFRRFRRRTPKQVVQQRPVVVEERPQQVRHGERDVLPVAIWQDMLLLGKAQQ
nr:hypothetical protein [Serratia proteamaculans]